VVKDAWYYTKRKTNVILVVDTSGSMKGEKLARAQEGLRVFLSQVKGDQERVGLIEFAGRIKGVVELDEMARNRTTLSQAVDQLEARGDTALLDAVAAAYDRLQALGDRERINAIVVMTDGRENHSQIKLRELERRLEEGNRTGVPVVVFCIAYGDDADYWVLKTIANATGGQVREGDLETIRELFKILSTYF
jgi:Ca-activated chloride channel family protein